MHEDIVTYFAYGSNMSERVISEVTPSAKMVGVARLSDWRLAFTRKSTRWKAGVADIVQSPGFWVYGVLYDIKENELEQMDRKEGAPKAYRRIDVTARASSGPVQAMTYTVSEPQFFEISPDAGYMGQIIS